MTDTNAKKRPKYSKEHRPTAQLHADHEGQASSYTDSEPSLFIYQSGSHGLPLTKDRLEKKNQLDMLIDGSMPYGRERRRRRSISNGNIFRHLYNEDNRPMMFPENLYDMKCAAASDNPCNISSPDPSERLQPASEGSLAEPMDTVQKNKPKNGPSSHAASYFRRPSYGRDMHYGPHSIYSAQIQGSRRIFKSNSHSKSGRSSNPKGIERFFRLPASHPYYVQSMVPTNPKIAAAMMAHNVHAATVPTTKMQRLLARLHKLAERVIDTRSCEPSSSRYSVQEVVALSRFFRALGNRPFSSVYSRDFERHRTKVDSGVPHFGSGSHPMPAFVGQSGQSCPCSSVSCHSAVSSESSPHVYDGSEDRLLPGNQSPATPRSPHRSIASSDTDSVCRTSHIVHETNLDVPTRPHRILDTVKRIFIRLTLLFQSFKYSLSTSSVRFMGHSLGYFGPTSRTRFVLWKVISASWFQSFLFILVCLQWMILSTITIRTNDDKTNIVQPYQFVLLVIQLVYMFEAIAKIIVYGFLFSSDSNQEPSQPSEKHWKRWLQNRWSCFCTGLHRHRSVRLPSIASASISLPSHNGDPAHVLSDSATTESIEDTGTIDQQAPWSRVEAYTSTPSEELFERLEASCGFSHSSSGRHLLSAHGSDIFDGLDASGVRNTTSPNIASPRLALDEEYDEYIIIKHCAYLNRMGNILDLVAIVSYWFDFSLMIYKQQTWSMFKALAATRILRLILITEGTKVIMESLVYSFDMLSNVFLFFAFFWVLYALLGVLLFTSAFGRRCAEMPPTLDKDIQNLTYIQPAVSCSGYYESEGVQRYPFDIMTGEFDQRSIGDGFICQVGQVCIQSTENQPGWGYINFNNILYAILSIFTVVSTEGWTDLMYISQDSASDIGAAIFYCLCIYLMTFILVPMFIAVITTSFSHVRNDIRQSAFAVKKKTRVLLTSIVGPEDECNNKLNGEWTCVQTYGHTTALQKEHRMRLWFHAIISSRYFIYAGSLLVLGSVIDMSLYNSTVSQSKEENLETTGNIFNYIFFIEIIIRIIGSLSWQQFWRYYRNRIDLILAIAAFNVELPVIRNYPARRYFALFAVLRCYRMVYLFPRVLTLLSSVIGDGQGFKNLTFFTFLTLFLLSPIAVQCFGGDFSSILNENDKVMRFDSFFQSFLALFQIMMGENWTDILYDAMHSQAHASPTYAAVFVVFLYFAIHYIVLNLFIAVVMENFDLDDDEIRQIQIKRYIRQHRWQPEYLRIDPVSRFLLPVFLKQKQRKLSLNSLPQNLVASVPRDLFRDFLVMHPTLSLPEVEAQENTRAKSVTSSMYGVRRLSAVSSMTTTTGFTEDNEKEQSEPLVKYGDEYEINVAMENKAAIMENLQVFRTLIYLSSDNRFRIFCQELLKNATYNGFIQVLLWLSIFLAVWADAEHRATNPKIMSVVNPFQAVCLGAFFADAFIHIVADGLVALPNSYLRNPWNYSDLVILFGQLIAWNLSDKRLSEKILRVLITLRVMKVVYYIEGMRVILMDLFCGLPTMIDAFVLNILVFVPFALYGCIIFTGRFSKCNDSQVLNRDQCHGEFISTQDDTNGFLLPRVWQNPYKYSFDNFGLSLLHLFECASGEGWILSLFSAMSVQQKFNDQPKFDWNSSSVWHSLYYIVFMFVASLCSIQLFIGVILEIFKKRRGISSLTNTQRQFQDLQRQLELITPSPALHKPPQGSFRYKCFELVCDKRGPFSKFMAIVTTVNLLILASIHLHQSYWVTYIQERLFLACLTLYTCEIIIRFIGLGFRKCLSSKWLLFDLFMVLLVAPMTIHRMVNRQKTPGLDALFFPVNPVYQLSQFSVDNIYRLVLLCPLFRFCRYNGPLDTFFRSIKRAVPSISYITAVFILVILCFAVTLEEIFATTRFGPYGNIHANFRNLWTTMITLWRITTGENWDFLMHDFTVESPNCVEGIDCGLPWAAITLFLVFYVVCTYIVVNLFTVVVINNFSFTFDKRNQFTLITRTDLRLYKKAWAVFDPKATGYIPKKSVPGFLRTLEGVLSINIYDQKHSIRHLLRASNEMDADMTHLVSVPISEHSVPEYTGVNIIGERYYNFHEVNKCLADMDTFNVRIKKRRYNFIYQEIMSCADSRGIGFHNMLRILAMQLVDASKSLTFDELVHRSRKRQNIAKELANEKAKNLVAMLIHRRQYIKERDEFRDIQLLNRELLENLMSTKNDQEKRHSNASGTDSSTTASQQIMMTDTSFPENKRPTQRGSTDVPRIILDIPHSKIQEKLLETTAPRVPPRPPSDLESPDLNFAGEPMKQWVTSSPFDGYQEAHSPEIHPYQLRSLPVSPRASLDKSVGVFLHYFAVESNLDMSKKDADELMHDFQNTTWSNLLQQMVE